MEERQITRAYNVEIKATEALKELAELELQVKDLQNAQKELRKEGKADSEEYVRMSQQIKGYKARQAELQKEIQTNIKLQNQEKGSLDQLSAQLSKMKASYRGLSDEVRESPFGQKMQQDIDALNDKLKEAEAAYGDNQRSVGDYAIAGRALTQELGEITDKLYELATAGQRGSEEYAELAQKAQELRKAQQAVDQEIEAGGSATKTIDGLTQAVGGVTAAYTVWQSATQLLGIENKDLEETMQKVIIATTALNALQQIQISLQKQSAVVILAKTVATKAAAAAQWLWNTAMAANPIGAIITVVAGLATAITGLVKIMKSSSREAELLSEAHVEAAKSISEEVVQINLLRSTLENTKDAEKRTEATKALAEATGQVFDATADYFAEEKRIIAGTDDYIDALQKRAIAQALLDRYSELAAQKAVEIAEQESKLYDTYGDRPDIDQIVKRAGAIVQINKKYAEDLGILQKAIENNSEAFDLLTGRNTQDEERSSDKPLDTGARGKADQLYDLAMQLSKRQQSLREASLKAEADYQKDDFATKAAYEQRLQLLQLNGEKERLDIQLRYKKISQSEYADNLKILEDNYRAFQNSQSTALYRYVNDVRKGLFDMIEPTLDEQIDEINKKYAEAFKKLDNEAKVAPVRLEGMSESEWEKIWSEYEDYLLAQGQLRLRLTKAQEKEIADVRYNERQKSKSDIDELIKREYEDDLAKYIDNEREKLRIEAEILQRRIEEYKKAGLDTSELEAELRANQASKAKLDLDSDLLSVQDNTRAKYEAQKAYLLKLKEIYADNADMLKKINQDLIDNEQKYLNESADNFAEWAAKKQQQLNQLNDFFNTISDSQLQRAEEQAEAEKAILEDKLNKNLISQEEYDKQVEKIDKKLAKEQAKIERESAIRERVIKSFSVITDTAVGIMKAVAASPLTGGLPWSAIVGTIGAAQLAAILAAPLPKASKGRLIDGPSHAGGGVPIEAEGGEVIINKKSSSAFLPLLSAINEAGGGVPFVRPLSDGGFAARYAMSGGNITKSELSQAIKDGFKDVKIIATVEDIRREEAHYINIENRANF